MSMDIRCLTTETVDWDGFVRSTPGGSPFHLLAWKQAVESGFGHRPHYLMAYRGAGLEGVLPRFEHENARGGIRWRTCSTTPGESPLWNLARDIAELVSGRADEERAIEIRRVLNFGRSAPAALAELLGCGANDHLCILIDQF